MKVTVPVSVIAAAGPKGKYGRSASLKWPWLYDKLRAQGYDKSKAAAISNSRLRFRKSGRLNVLKAEEAHSPKVLSKVAKADKARKHLTRRQLTASVFLVPGTLSHEFACHSAACAPPPAGTGGSKPGRSRPYNADHARAIHALRNGPAPLVPSESATKRMEAEGHIARTGKRIGNSTVYRLTDSGKEVLSRVGFNDRSILTINDAHEFPVITAAEARGDSRPVTHAEFQRLAKIGQSQLDKFAADSSPIKGLDERWDSVKAESYAEVVKSWGGATIDAHTGVALPQGANKYAITVKGKGSETVSVPETATAAEFSAAMDTAKAQFRTILERQSHYLGVFHDDDHNRIDIDPVLVVTKREDVDTIGAASRSIGGAYNFSDGNGYWPPHVAGG